MERLHPTYRRKAPDTYVNAADVAALASVKLDTARRWTRRPGFPAAATRDPNHGHSLWTLGAVLDWLCTTGRRDCASEHLLKRSELCERFGLAEQTIKVYTWRGDFPAPTAYRGRSPLWDAAVVQEWVDKGGRVDRRRKVPA